MLTVTRFIDEVWVTFHCNECNEALQAARDALAAARRLAFVAENAVANGDSNGAQAALMDLRAATEQIGPSVLRARDP